MSFDRLSSLEAQTPSTGQDAGASYQDDPDFQRLTESLSNQLFTLTSNISRLSNQIGLLGTKRDTERVRERIHNLLEETRDGFRDVGEGVKKVQMWEDITVSTLARAVREESKLLMSVWNRPRSPRKNGHSRNYLRSSNQRLKNSSPFNVALSKSNVPLPQQPERLLRRQAPRRRPRKANRSSNYKSSNLDSRPKQMSTFKIL